MKFYGIRRLSFGRLCQRETPLTEDNIVFTSSPIHVRSIKALDEGMIRVGDLKGDYFHYEPRSHALIGRRSGARYQLGDAITVKVDAVNPEKRQIDFVPVGRNKSIRS